MASSDDVGDVEVHRLGWSGGRRGSRVMETTGKSISGNWLMAHVRG